MQAAIDAGATSITVRMLTITTEAVAYICLMRTAQLDRRCSAVGTWRPPITCNICPVNFSPRKSDLDPTYSRYPEQPKTAPRQWMTRLYPCRSLTRPSMQPPQPQQRKFGEGHGKAGKQQRVAPDVVFRNSTCVSRQARRSQRSLWWVSTLPSANGRIRNNAG